MNDHREIRIACDCSTPTHFLQVEWNRWAEWDEDINVFFCAHRIGGFWKRVARAARYVFGAQELITSDIVISKQSTRELAAFLSEIAPEPDDEEYVPSSAIGRAELRAGS